MGRRRVTVTICFSPVAILGVASASATSASEPPPPKMPLRNARGAVEMREARDERVCGVGNRR